MPNTLVSVIYSVLMVILLRLQRACVETSREADLHLESGDPDTLKGLFLRIIKCPTFLQNHSILSHPKLMPD